MVQNAGAIIVAPIRSVTATSSLHSPTTVSSRSGSWALREEIVKKFSQAANEEEKKSVDKHIKDAVNAYQDALVHLRGAVKSDELNKILGEQTTVAELHKTAAAIQHAQANVLDKRKVGKFVEAVNLYSGVFDVLAQCDFSYMTLIWGVMKFVLVISKNHHDMLMKFTDMISEVGRNLGRVELYRSVFPTTRMLELVSELYAAILEFLIGFITYMQKRTYKKFWVGVTKPFDMQFGRLRDSIRGLFQTIEDDAKAGHMLMTLVQTKSISRHRVDLALRRDHYETTLRDINEGQFTQLFGDIKDNLFRGFEIEASYHEQLATTFRMTSSSQWAYWLSIEQRWIPSKPSRKTTLVQAECDAPDAATCLQWIAQTRADSPQIVSAFLLWASGMTAQSAIASILFQMLQQRPYVLTSAGLSTRDFAVANSSLNKLWALFASLVRQLGGLMVYISIGSVGDEEYDIVERFVDLTQHWSGPPVNVIIVHPFDEKFVHVDDAVDIDDKYDVHPCLTTTDALHHVVLLELNVQENLSETVEHVLWEALWREVRYAVIGIAATQTVEEINAAAILAAKQSKLGDGPAELWTLTVQKWTDNKRMFHVMREQIQRHLSCVELYLTPEVRKRLEQKVKFAVRSRLDADEKHLMTTSLKEGEPRPLDDEHRKDAWVHMQKAIRPGTMAMYNGAIPGLMVELLTAYMKKQPESEGEARTLVQTLFKGAFGWHGTWKATFSDDQTSVVEGIIKGISTGFGDVVNSMKLQMLGDEESEPSP